MNARDLKVGEMYEINESFMNYHINLMEDHSVGIAMFLGHPQESSYRHEFLMKNGTARTFETSLRGQQRWFFRHVVLES